MRLERHRFRSAQQPSDLRKLTDELGYAIDSIPPDKAKRFRVLRRTHDLLKSVDEQELTVTQAMKLALLLPRLQGLARELEESLSQTAPSTAARTRS